jgi:phosphoglycerate kinase
MHTLTEADLKGKRVFFHADYSVPIKDGVIEDDYRITTSFPSLDFLMEKGAKIIIGSKMGDPKGKYVEDLELRPVAEYLADHYPDHTMYLAHDIDHDDVRATIETMKPGDMLMLPNLRFYPEEQAGDEAFAQKLAALADLYINDSFAVDHRSDASVAHTPKYLPSYEGMQLKKELDTLGQLLQKPEHPFVVIMGGAKVSDKMGVINALAKQADHILVGGAMANTFMLAKKEDVGASKVEADKVDLADQLMKDLGEKLILAADYVKEEKDGSFSYLDIGEKAVEQFQGYLKDAKTIFWNGSLGYTEDPRFAKGSEAIATYIAGLKGVTSVVAGGDTDELLAQLKIRDKFTFVSTGGGAALEFLAGEELPGVEALEEAPEVKVEMPLEEKPAEEVAEPMEKPVKEEPEAEMAKEEPMKEEMKAEEPAEIVEEKPAEKMEEKVEDKKEAAEPMKEEAEEMVEKAEKKEIEENKE